MWVKLDDAFADDPRVLRAGRAAAWLHVEAMCYCARHLTDGQVPRQAIGRSRIALARRLVSVGLWRETPEGFFIPDYMAWNPSAADVKERRAKDLARQRQGFHTDSAGNSERKPVRNPKVPSRTRTRTRKGKTEELRTVGELLHNTDGAQPTLPVPETTAEKYAGLILPMIGEERKRDYWLEQFRRAPEAALVLAHEEFEQALARGGIANRAAYFTQVLQRHRNALAGEARG